MTDIADAARARVRKMPLESNNSGLAGVSKSSVDF
jgi:hypothetical protein